MSIVITVLSPTASVPTKSQSLADAYGKASNWVRYQPRRICSRAARCEGGEGRDLARAFRAAMQSPGNTRPSHFQLPTGEGFYCYRCCWGSIY